MFQFRSVAMLALGALLFSASCRRKSVDVPDCRNVMCTTVFSSVMVNVVDAAGEPVVLDEVYTIRTSTGERIAANHMGDGIYAVVDDSYQSQIENLSEGFRFTGRKNGRIVVDEPYYIKADCCHVSKVNGKAVVTTY
ncbi:MAG: hypothetical protein V4649_12180 [Bacteroidota bacterium]